MAALGDETGRVLARDRFPTPQSGDPGADLAAMAERARELVAREGLSAPTAVGASVPGPLDAETGVVLSPPNLRGWERVPVRATLEAAFDAPVAIENDANAAALAEWRHGAARGFEDVIYLTMSTGVGGGLIFGGELHRGIASSAGEVGHMAVEWDGAPCPCGLRGCLEAYVGGAAWTRRLAEVTPADSRVAALAGSGEAARPEHVVAAAREGCAFALAEFERFNTYLARGLAPIVTVLAPQIIVLGTIVAAAGEELCLAPVRRKLREHVWSFLGDGVRIEAATLGKRLPELAGLAVAERAGPPVSRST